MKSLLNSTPGRIVIAFVIVWFLYHTGMFDFLLKPDCSVNPDDILKGCKKG